MKVVKLNLEYKPKADKMTEYQIQSKQANLSGDLEDITKKLEKFYYDLTRRVDDKYLIESLDSEKFLDDVRDIRDIAKSTIALLGVYN